MKKILVSCPILLLVWILIPLSLVMLNNHLGLPIINNLGFKIVGFILFSFGLSVVAYFTRLHLKTGRTTPLPLTEAPRQLITNDLYKYSRNPMYIAILLTFTGQFLFFGHILLLAYPCIAFIVLNLFITCFEEPELKKRFGDQYTGYIKRVPKWL